MPFSCFLFCPRIKIEFSFQCESKTKIHCFFFSCLISFVFYGPWMYLPLLSRIWAALSFCHFWSLRSVDYAPGDERTLNKLSKRTCGLPYANGTAQQPPFTIPYTLSLSHIHTHKHLCSGSIWQSLNTYRHSFWRKTSWHAESVRLILFDIFN